MFKDIYAKAIAWIEKIMYPNLIEDLGLYDTVLICKTELLACRIAKKIKNPELLKKLVEHTFPSVRILALFTLKDVKIAERVVLHDLNWEVRLAALEFVTSKRVLKKASSDQNKKVQKAAIKKLKEKHNA